MSAVPSIAAVRAAHSDLWLASGKWPCVREVAGALGCSYSAARGLMAVAQLPASNGSVPAPKRRPVTVSKRVLLTRRPHLGPALAGRLTAAAACLELEGFDDVAAYLAALATWHAEHRVPRRR